MLIAPAWSWHDGFRSNSLRRVRNAPSGHLISQFAMLQVSMVEETPLDVIRDPGIRDPWRAVQKLLDHMPRIVENQQRLGPIVGQLACDHYGLEPQVNGIIWFVHSQALRSGLRPQSWETGAVTAGGSGWPGGESQHPARPSKPTTQSGDNCPEVQCLEVQGPISMLDIMAPTPSKWPSARCAHTWTPPSPGSTRYAAGPSILACLLK